MRTFSMAFLWTLTMALIYWSFKCHLCWVIWMHWEQGWTSKGQPVSDPACFARTLQKKSQLSDINPMISGKEVIPKGTSTVTIDDDVPEEDKTVAIADFTKLSLKVEYDGLASSHLKSAWYQRCHQRNFRKWLDNIHRCKMGNSVWFFQTVISMELKNARAWTHYCWPSAWWHGATIWER